MRDGPTFIHSLLAAGDSLEQRHAPLEHFEARHVDQIGAGQSVLGDEDRLATPIQLLEQFKTYPNAMPPIWNNNGWSQGLSSAAFLQGEQWGEWDGALVIGYMGISFGDTPIGQRIDVLRLSPDGTSVIDATRMTLPMKPGRFRSLVLGPDGSLYAAVDEGTIYKLTPRH